MKKNRLDRFKEAGLMGCFNGTGVSSTNYKEHLYNMEWISVKDKLPKMPGHYLVVADWMSVIEKGEFNGRDRWYINHLFEPTHWMPLPQPPKE